MSDELITLKLIYISITDTKEKPFRTHIGPSILSFSSEKNKDNNKQNQTHMFMTVNVWPL